MEDQEQNQGWWFDRAHQRKYILEMARDSMIENPEMSAGEALTRSEILMDLYFAKHVNPVTRIN